MINNQEQLNDLASEYVLGTLVGEERAAFEQQLLINAEARDAVALWEELLAGLNEQVPEIAPPKSAFVRVLERLGVISDKRLSRWRWLTSLSFVAAALFATVAAVQYFDPEQRYLRDQVAKLEDDLRQRDQQLLAKQDEYSQRAAQLQQQVATLEAARQAAQTEMLLTSANSRGTAEKLAATQRELDTARAQMQQVLEQLTAAQQELTVAKEFQPRFVSLVMAKEQLAWEIHADNNGLVQVKRVADAAPQAGKDYALWVVRADGTVRPIGYISKIGKKVFELNAGDLEGLQAFAVSLEKENAELRDAPAGPVVYSGKANQYQL